MTNLIFAILITTSAGTFDVEAATGTVDANFELIQAQPWFGNLGLASEIAAGLADVLGLSPNGPLVLSTLFINNTPDSGVLPMPGENVYFYEGAFYNPLNGKVVSDLPRPFTSYCANGVSLTGGPGCRAITFAVEAPTATVPIAGMAILLTLMIWIMEAARWSRPL